MTTLKQQINSFEQMPVEVKTLWNFCRDKLEETAETDQCVDVDIAKHYSRIQAVLENSLSKISIVEKLEQIQPWEQVLFVSYQIDQYTKEKKIQKIQMGIANNFIEDGIMHKLLDGCSKEFPEVFKVEGIDITI